jgi:hypothetical protein
MRNNQSNQGVNGMELKFKTRQMKLAYFCPSDGSMGLTIEFAIADVGAITIAELERLCKSKCEIQITEAADEPAK